VLQETGLTPYQLAPPHFRTLLAWRIGLTDIAKQVCGQDKDLPPASLAAPACQALQARITTFQPERLAFTSFEAGKRFLKRKVRAGLQPETIGRTAIWVLPSPSPAAHWHWDPAWWQALATDIYSDSFGMRKKSSLF